MGLFSWQLLIVIITPLRGLIEDRLIRGTAVVLLKTDELLEHHFVILLKTGELVDIWYLKNYPAKQLCKYCSIYCIVVILYIQCTLFFFRFI